MEKWVVREIIDRDLEYRRLKRAYRRHETICVLAAICVAVIVGITSRAALVIFGLIGLGIYYFVVLVLFMPKIEKRKNEIVEEILRKEGVI